MKTLKVITSTFIALLFITFFLLLNINVAFAQPETKITADDAAEDDWFGVSVSISGDYAVIGAPQDDDDGPLSGSAYIFIRDGADWTQQAKLTADDAAAGDHFGCSVSINGDYAVIGSYYDDDDGSYSGSAYIFIRNGENWTQQAKLTAADAAASDFFGGSVSISGIYAVIGAYTDDDGDYSGSAYIFHRNGEDWTQRAKLTAADAATYDRFGCSVSINGNYAVIGAYTDDDDGESSGSAYIFVRDGANWPQQAKLTAADAAAYDYFGCSVSISDDYAVIGAYGDDDGGDISGSTYIFVREDADWTQQAKLTAADAAEGDRFGSPVSISGDYAVIGAYRDDDDGDESGSAYIYQHRASKAFPRSKWEMIGIPVTVNDGDAATLFRDNFNDTNPGEHWRASSWDVANQTYLRYGEDNYPNNVGGDPPDFVPGLGFWMKQIAVDNCVIDISSDQVNDYVPQDARYDVQLQSRMTEPVRRGINQLANPFNYIYDWRSTSIYNEDDDVIKVISDAAAAFWINGYAYTWDSDGSQFVAVNFTGDSDYNIGIWEGFWCEVLTTDEIHVRFKPNGYVGGLAPPRPGGNNDAPPFDSPPASEGGGISAISSASEGGGISAISSASEAGWISTIPSASEIIQECVKSPEMSFPRRRESNNNSNLVDSCLRRNDTLLSFHTDSSMGEWVADRDDYDNWTLKLQVSTADEEYKDIYNKAGINPRSDDNYDPLDAFEFTPMSDSYVHLYFPHDWDAVDATRFTYDYRSPEFDGAKVWEFTVKVVNLPNREFVINWHNIGDIYYYYFFWLEDADGNRICDMRETKEFTFRSGDSDTEELNYRLVVEYHPEGIEGESAVIPSEFGIVSAYPNPFNSEIRIRFNLASADNVALKVFDLQGREVGVIGKGNYSAGSHQLMWDASALSSGMYIVRLVAEGEVSARKVVLMR